MSNLLAKIRALRPLRLSFDGERLQLNVLFVLNKKSEIRRGGLKVGDIALSGMEETWTVAKPLTPEIEDRFLAFVEKRQPERLPEAKAFLKKAFRDAAKTKQDLEHAEANLRRVAKILDLPLADNLADKTKERLADTVPRINLDVTLETIPRLLGSPGITKFWRWLTFRRRPVCCYLTELKIFPSHVGSPLWRRVWGVLKYGQLEAMGWNWSLGSPGYMCVNSALAAPSLKRVAAHEFGHILGLGDAYGAFYRFYDEYPDARHYLMFSNGALSDEEFAMFLKAHTVNRAQFFPKRFSWARIKKGFKREKDYYARKISDLGKPKNKEQI